METETPTTFGRDIILASVLFMAAFFTMLCAPGPRIVEPVAPANQKASLQPTSETAKPRSIWTSVNGQWQGSVLFGSGNFPFELSGQNDGQYGQNRGTFGTGSINDLFDMDSGSGEMTSSY